MAADPRLKGQEVVLRILQDGQLVDELQAIGSFNDEVKLEIKEDGFLGEPTNRFDQILNGYGGDLEFQTNTSGYLAFIASIEGKAKRTVFPVFNIVRTDLYVNGQTAVITYPDVKWGAIPTSVGGRGEYAKTKLAFSCEDRTVQINAI